MRLLLGIVALLAATPAMATDFVLAGRSGNAAQILADRDAIQKTGDGIITARLVYVLAADRGRLAALDMTNEFDCTNRRFRHLRLVGVDVQGKPLGPEEKALNWQNVVDGDTSAGVLDFICSGEALDKNATSVGTNLPDVIVVSRRRLEAKKAD